MKKYFIVFTLFLFLLLSFFSNVFAKDSKLSEYPLPYPGILPDNPLYVLKTTRDKVISFLVSDPIKKAEFNLLQSEKRLGGGLYLFKKGINKEKLAQETISKGENYFEEAIVSIQQAKKEGRNTTSIVEKLALSSKKQAEVIKELEKQVQESYKKDFEILYQRVVKLGKKVSELSPTPL